ncbi:3' terminal RNA ribose 2'-O-methyltransferase Hen1 [Paenibacillus phyllosphaerae]|uniref:Small RNA 2'-O-methyltransferase n=1 Tax=Paenibacillus phyllosphaerae TaxID=274593 RepID=A0A7W5B055_9BACL|nr:3' terminal RNA ribose 2'-O-methyltransferase Hen1 [Paenibacillus phyllosphaerae]MBB3112020.1 3' terminal RNA ribose 2'-O-methyltransferase Hen1 [Paenibacillus phyllosphaerae]
MHLIIRAEGTDARAVSYLLAKNPNNLYDRDEKGVRVRLVYTVCTDDEVEAVLYATPDPVDLVKGSPDSYDITQYINDREFVVSSLFCTYIRSALGTALNGKTKEEYLPWVTHSFPFTLSFGPVASNLPDAIVEQLFEPLGYKVELERGVADYSFELKSRSSVRYVTLRGEVTLQQALRQLLILIPVLDDYKHHYVGQDEIDKLARYGEGWLDPHPLRELILKRSLRFSNIIAQFEARLRREAALSPVNADDGTDGQSMADGEPQTDGEPRMGEEPQTEEQPKIRLNELRYQAITNLVSGLDAKRTIVDYGSGEGKLAARLSSVEGVAEVLAVEPSAMSQLRAIERFDKLADHGQKVVPTPVTGSLFYYDETLRGKDVIVLCEVIEHIDAPRLNKVMDTVLNEYRPQTLIVTTPNREYNAVYEMDQSMRHNDHRFEWTRGEFADACDRWRTSGYTVEMQGIGEEVAGLGQPTQMAVFSRREEREQR